MLGAALATVQTPAMGAPSSSLPSPEVPTPLLGNGVRFQYAEAGTFSLAQCPSGYFCVYSGNLYTGSLWMMSTVGATFDITISPTRSVYNNRITSSWIYENPAGGGSSRCFLPGVSVSGLSGWQLYSESARISYLSSC